MTSSSINLPYLKLLELYKQLLLSTNDLATEIIEFKEQTNNEINDLDLQVQTLIDQINQ